MSNEHIDNAERWLDQLPDGSTSGPALIESVLAVAYELRTLSLIGAAQLGITRDPGNWTVESQKIGERLS